jgi:hypothetical protein
VTLIPIIHIPSVAENVFYQTVITWEWGLVFGASLVFILCAEFYKACIRPSVVRCVRGGGGEKCEREEQEVDVWKGGNVFGSAFFGFDIFGKHAWPGRDIWSGGGRFSPRDILSPSPQAYRMREKRDRYPSCPGVSLSPYIYVYVYKDMYMCIC